MTNSGHLPSICAYLTAINPRRLFISVRPWCRSKIDCCIGFLSTASLLASVWVKHVCHYFMRLKKITVKFLEEKKRHKKTSDRRPAKTVSKRSPTRKAAAIKESVNTVASKGGIKLTLVNKVCMFAGNKSYLNQ